MVLLYSMCIVRDRLGSTEKEKKKPCIKKKKWQIDEEVTKWNTLNFVHLFSDNNFDESGFELEFKIGDGLRRGPMSVWPRGMVGSN
jgi:hypothetical protein